MQIDVWCETDTGLKRSNNQDTFLVDEELGLYVVADGMGGHRGGEVASQLAVDTVQHVVRESLKSDKKMNPWDLLLTAYREASARIFDKSQDGTEDYHGMGTTMVVALHRGDKLYIGNVGDSRCYFFSSPLLWQITEDHSLVNEQVRAGLINENDIGKFVPKNIITRSVGYEREVSPDFFERKVSPGELFLICSDGLTGMIEDVRITEILLEERREQVAPRCIEEAKNNGGDDNVTVMLIGVKE